MCFPHNLPLQGVLANLSIYGHYNIGDEEVRHAHSRDVLSLSQHLMGTHYVPSPFTHMVSIGPQHILSIFSSGDRNFESFSNKFKVTPVRLLSDRAIIQTQIL